MFPVLHSADYQVNLSMFYLYLLNPLVIPAAVFQGSLLNVNLMYQELRSSFITHEYVW